MNAYDNTIANRYTMEALLSDGTSFQVVLPDDSFLTCEKYTPRLFDYVLNECNSRQTQVLRTKITVENRWPK